MCLKHNTYNLASKSRSHKGPLRLITYGALWEGSPAPRMGIWWREHHEGLEGSHHQSAIVAIEKAVTAIKPEKYIPARETMSRCCAWHHRIYNRANWGNHGRGCDCGKQVAVRGFKKRILEKCQSPEPAHRGANRRPNGDECQCRWWGRRRRKSSV